MTTNQSGNRNSIFGWVKNLKRNTLSNESVNEIGDDLDAATSRSPSRSSFQSGPSYSHSQAVSASPTKEKTIPQSYAQSNSNWLPGAGGASDFLRPLLSHKSRSTNNVNQSRSDSISRSSSNQDNSVGIRQYRDSFLQTNSLVDENSKYFGVPLADAINQAAAKISILSSTSNSGIDENVLHYGKIPIVVAKCGVYLKKSGLNVEGIFRVGGSSKRIKELQIIFNSPPDFGKKLNWEGFTVHDAASVLRRYLNALPEPLIPLDLYEEFRDPLRSRQRIIKYLKYKADNFPRGGTKTSQQANISGMPNDSTSLSNTKAELTDSTSHGYSETATREFGTVHANRVTPEEGESFQKSSGLKDDTFVSNSDKDSKSKKPNSYKKLTRDVYGAIAEYKLLLDDLPGYSKQLLFYILDLLAMVQSSSDENLMSSRNLAAIFQPSILSHPSHDMDLEEYALSQSVVEFLIQYSYKLLPNNEAKPDSSSTVSANSSGHAEPSKQSSSRRQHSKSLSTPNQDLDFVGYRNSSKPLRGLTLSDTDHDFVSASSEDDEELDRHIQRTWPKELLVKPQDEETRSVPMVILDDTSKPENR